MPRSVLRPPAHAAGGATHRCRPTIGRVRIRPAIVGDAAQIAELHVRSWQAGYAGLVPQQLLDGIDLAGRLTRWKELLRETDWPRSGTLVAEEDGRLVGFARLCPERGTARSTGGEVAAFHVTPARWREGIGRTLIRVALAQLANAGFGNAILWVVYGNDRAMHFYEAMGWREDGAQRLVPSNALKGHVVKEIRMTRPLP